MYGTIARIRIQPGKQDAVKQLTEKFSSADASIRGMLFQYVYQLDNEPNECMLVVGFESKEAYTANAQSEEQHQRYQAFREHFAADPEWHDGEIVFSFQK
jgi:quinol monooxygenase YgiN